ncbi:MBL fold metallo-hydrolase [Ferruginibacter paludis]|uniref:MBL fold metallo-hydrolase n=1 Tax=Ferruginibacter paludis TaxID=1310417 RepID=UPI0025B5FEC0|nr:MBL fold metallo-hydrolase [Ferruginibacter paludis]MDN3657661.1 MBL fold metallo-hydrolase [Ferruginibacter paludis]
MQSPPLKITFLGTGTSTGVPMVACPCPVCASEDKKDKRLRSSILVQSAATSFVVDTTPDFRYQMLREQIKQLDAVLFTHPHKDHIAGLDDVKAFSFFSGKAMEVYANTLTEEGIKREFAYIFADKRYPGIPEINLNTIDSTPFMIGDIPVTPILVWHMKMPVMGYRFGKFTYITDANRIEPEEKKKIKGSEILVVNALRHAAHVSHFTLDEAIDLVKELEIPTAYFTHVSHQLGKHADVAKELPLNMHLAYDGLTLSFT